MLARNVTPPFPIPVRLGGTGVDNINDILDLLGLSSLVPPSLTVPDTPTGLSAIPGFFCVSFIWDVSVEDGHRDYIVRTKVDGDAWSPFAGITSNYYTRSLTDAEISAHGNQPTIYIEVKARNILLEVSAVAAEANGIPDTIEVADLSGAAFEIAATDSESTADLTLLYDGVKSGTGVTYTNVGPEQWTQFAFPVGYTFNQVLIWASASVNCYLGYSLDGATWSYLKAEADHALDSSGKLVEATSQADAQTNYWTTGTGSPVVGLWPYMRQAKLVRIYYQATVTIYELKFWTFVLADEIQAGVIRLARGITIASSNDPVNAVLMDSSGLRSYVGGVQRVNIANDGTFWFGNSTGSNSLKFTGGVLTLTGTLVVASASGYSNFSDKPSLGTLSGLNTAGASNLDSTVISGGKIVTGLLTADNIQAGTLLAARLSTSIAYITDSAQIANAVITNAKIGDLEVNSAKIADLTVGTTKITGNAITATGASTTDAQLNASANSETLVQEFFMDHTGAPVLVWFSCVSWGAAACSCTFYLYDQLTLIKTVSDIYFDSGNAKRTVAFVHLDPTPSAGANRNYRVTCLSNTNTAHTCRTLAVTELKK